MTHSNQKQWQQQVIPSQSVDIQPHAAIAVIASNVSTGTLHPQHAIKSLDHTIPT